MKALEILKHMASKAKTKTQSDILIEAIAELEEFMKPKSCDGCKYGRFGVDSLGIEVNCTIEYVCSRGQLDRYEPKEQ